MNDNKGNVYPDKKKALQLLIDIKSDAVTTLEAIVKELEKHSSSFKKIIDIKWNRISMEDAGSLPTR